MSIHYRAHAYGYGTYVRRPFRIAFAYDSYSVGSLVLRRDPDWSNTS